MSSFPPQALSSGRMARDTLRRLLNPSNDTEDRYVEWLCGWDTETVETFAAMVSRAVAAGPVARPSRAANRAARGR